MITAQALGGDSLPQQTLSAPATTVAAGLPAPAARRLRRPSWSDPRLIVGLVLVLTSVVAGAVVVRQADGTEPVWAVRRTMTPGQQITAADLVVRHVRLGDERERYVRADKEPATGSVLLRPVGEGELLPAAAVGAREQVDLRPVAVPVLPEAADGLRPGALVDVWVAARGPSGQDSFVSPRLVAAAVQVSALADSRGPLGASTTSAVRLLLTPELVPTVIEAVDNQAKVTLVPVPATLARPGS